MMPAHSAPNFTASAISHSKHTVFSAPGVIFRNPRIAQFFDSPYGALLQFTGEQLRKGLLHSHTVSLFFFFASFHRFSSSSSQRRLYDEAYVQTLLAEYASFSWQVFYNVLRVWEIFLFIEQSDQPSRNWLRFLAFYFSETRHHCRTLMQCEERSGTSFSSQNVVNVGVQVKLLT